MKILKLKFKNLNSLESEHTINFEEAPFSNTGVFAITGPNGSGKSTILDAITLGLFGETFRFDRPADHVMTKNSSECYSEIEFSVAQNKYRSSWSIGRIDGDPAGELMPTEMKLVRLAAEEEILAETPTQVCSKINDITGMNFRSFTRSIMLAQGDFAAFLNALDSERLDILEKIVGSEIYADYQKNVIDQADASQQSLDYLKRELSNIALLDAEKLEASEHDLIDFREQVSEFQQQQHSLKQQQSLLSSIAAMQKQLAEQEKSLKAAETEVETEQQKLENLKLSEGALNFKDDIAAIANANQSVHDRKDELSALQDELKQLKNKLATVNAGLDNSADLTNLTFSEQQQTIATTRTQVNVLNSNRQAAMQLSLSLGSQIREKNAIHASVKLWLEEHAVDRLLVENFPDIGRLKKLKQELVELNEKLKAFTLWSAKATVIQKKNSGSFEKQDKSFNDLKFNLTEEEKAVETLLQTRTIEEIEELQQEQKERVSSVRELISLSESYQKLAGTSGFFSIFKSKAKPDFDAEELAQELANLKQQISREENIKLALDEKMHLETIIKKMTAERHFLVDGKPCPLCGSLQHPFSKSPPPISNSQQAVIDQLAKLKALKAQVEVTERNRIVATKQSENNKEKYRQMQQIKSQWLTLCNRLNAANQDLEINNQGSMKDLLKNEITELTEITSLISKYRIKQKNIAKLNGLIAKKSVVIEQLQSGGQQLDTEWQSRAQAQTENEAALTVCQQEEKALFEKLFEQLAVLGESMPENGAEDTLFERLNSRRHEYDHNVLRNTTLTDELAILTERLNSCEAEVKDCDEQLSHFSAQLDSDETIGLHLALLEKQKLIAAKEQQLAALETEEGKLLQLIRDKIQGSEFTDLNHISNMLELMETKPALEQRVAELMNLIQRKTLEIEKSQEQLNAQSVQVESELSLEDIAIQLRSINQKLDIAQQETQRLEKLLIDQEHYKQAFNSLSLKLNEQEKITQQHLDEKALLTIENGMVFRRRVQSQMADKLLSQTNAILEKISGRYYIRQAPSQQGLALEIEDTFQKNARRLPKTLSGGESFIVSLALALGLSELANNGKSVDSLFLDEGFGNLDAETLYTVITTLEGLRTHGKTVGVISHVDAVKKCIKAQLQVVKKPNGMGMLKKAS